ncbi:MAG: winged helix-turn-helix domain-containing protein [Candidatus Diapherotrites archaeon]
MADVTISTQEFKALSSDVRVNVIKMLNERNYTLSEISVKLGMAAPSTKQHMQTLMDTGIVRRIEEGRKWKYYQLTKKGRDIANAEENQTNILIVLGAVLIGLVGIMTIMFAGIGTLSILPSQAGAEFGTGFGEDSMRMPVIAAPAEMGIAEGENDAALPLAEKPMDDGTSAAVGGGMPPFTEEDCLAINMPLTADEDANAAANDLNALEEYCNRSE